jgi:hypothetical protein
MVPWDTILEQYEYVLLTRGGLLAHPVPASLIPIFVGEDFELYKAPISLHRNATTDHFRRSLRALVTS